MSSSLISTITNIYQQARGRLHQMLKQDHKVRSKLEQLKQAEQSIQNAIPTSEVNQMTVEQDNVIHIKRTYKPNVTLGEMIFPDGTVLKTVELPNLDNKPMVSCIPEGTYTVKKRFSPVVKRTSKGKFEQGWEVNHVPNRSYIMVHIGNTVKDFNGCIGVGTAHGVVHGLDGVLNSRVAFDKFMQKMEKFDVWTFVIEKA